VNVQVLQAFFSTTAVPDSDPASALLKELFDFQRISLTTSQLVQQTFSISANTFITYDGDGNQVLYPGAYTVTITNGVDLVCSPPHNPLKPQILTASVELVGAFRIVDSFL
jgi:hypothetical protein